MPVENQGKFVYLHNVVNTFIEGCLESAFSLSWSCFLFPGIQVSNKSVPGKERENRKREEVVGEGEK